MLASAAVPALHNVPLRRSLRAIHSTRLMQTLASIAALARLSALLELSLRVEFQVNDPTYMKSKRRLSRCDSLLCFYKVLFSPIKRGCRIKRRIKSCAGAASPFKIALKPRDSHRSFLSLRREPLIQNSPSALMTGRLGHVGLSGCRSCSPHSLLRSVRIRFIRAAYSKQFFRGLPHPSGPDP
jgi:hypothetical protein